MSHSMVQSVMAAFQNMVSKTDVNLGNTDDTINPCGVIRYCVAHNDCEDSWGLNDYFCDEQNQCRMCSSCLEPTTNIGSVENIAEDTKEESASSSMAALLGSELIEVATPNSMMSTWTAKTREREHKYCVRDYCCTAYAQSCILRCRRYYPTIPTTQ